MRGLFINLYGWDLWLILSVPPTSEGPAFYVCAIVIFSWNKMFFMKAQKQKRVGICCLPISEKQRFDQIVKKCWVHKNKISIHKDTNTKVIAALKWLRYLWYSGECMSMSPLIPSLTHIYRYSILINTLALFGERERERFGLDLIGGMALHDGYLTAPFPCDQSNTIMPVFIRILSFLAKCPFSQICIFLHERSLSFQHSNVLL